MSVRNCEYEDQREDLMTDDDSDEICSYTSFDRTVLNSSGSLSARSFLKTPTSEKLDELRSRNTSINTSIKDTARKRSLQGKKESVGGHGNMKPCRHISYIWIATVLVVLVSVLVANCLPRSKTTQHTSLHRSKQRMCVEHAQIMHITLMESMKEIESKFHNQNFDIWTEISSGLYNALLCPGKPGIIVLLGDRGKTMKCLAHQLGSLSSRILGRSNYLTLTPKDFKNDIGEVIHELKDIIAEKKVVVVEDLLHINSEALKAFHNFCDTENPLINDALYIITMTTDNYNMLKNELYNAEKSIIETFHKSIEKDVLDPLITRITCGAVVFVQPEPDLQNCTL